MNTSDSGRRWLWIALAGFSLVGLGAFFFPAFVIQPFRYQHPRVLLWAMAVRDRAPLISLLCAIAGFLLVAALWRSCNLWRKLALAVAALALTVSAVMSRLNYFEWMFHPVGNARFESESSSKLA